MTTPIIDAHLDLSWCALSFERDLTGPLDELNRHEADMTDSRSRGNATVTFEEMRRGNLAVSIGTMLARARPKAVAGKPGRDGLPTLFPSAKPPAEGVKRVSLDYANQAVAHSIAQGQMAWYRLMERQGHIRLIRTRSELDAHWQAWTANGHSSTPLGIILSMEGADPITTPDEAALWFEHGLRAVGPVHYGRSAYAVGTGDDGPLTPAGHDLLKALEELGMLVDVTHLSDTSFFETLDRFGGRVLASHHNCRTLVPNDRQLSDEQIRLLIERDAVIGSALDAWMLHPGWKLGETQPDVVSLEAVADHIDHVCQLAGNTRHAALGSDLDGGFGTEQTPRDLSTIADMQKLGPILAGRGYSPADLEAIFHGNWLRLFRESLPA